MLSSGQISDHGGQFGAPDDNGLAAGPVGMAFDGPY